jgi:hypothetical protein
MRGPARRAAEMNAGQHARGRGRAAFLVGLVVILAQLVLVRVAGTDIPFHDQWDAEGRGLYPDWVEGARSPAHFFQPHNEHRIVWTRLLDVTLFALNGGQWDPLVQLCANALLHGLLAAVVTWVLLAGVTRGRWAAALALALFFVPVAGWHNALWGFQSQVYFAAGFSVAALALLAPMERSGRRTAAGLGAGLAGLGAMAPAGLVPFALLGLAGVRVVARRRLDGAFWRDSWPAWLLLAVALALHPATGDPVAPAAFLAAAARMLAWPHVESPLAGLVMNLPLAATLFMRMRRARPVTPPEDGVLAVGLWAVAVALAAAWARGDNAEMIAGVPSRYVDLIGLLPLANAWCAVAAARHIPRLRVWMMVWMAFAWLGWLALSMEATRGVILPRARDTDAPSRLARRFQETDDAAVFAGQPRLLVPHPDLGTVRAVLGDLRLAGRLPPSLQPERPMGPLSSSARTLLGRPRKLN